MQLTIAQDISSLQQSLAELAAQGKRIALVPTMGALHAGHQVLIRVAAQVADVVAVSIFVNPSQFGANEDFSKYPRMLEEDINKAVEAGASLIYAPPAQDIYPEGFSTSITVGPLSQTLEGASRPGHFDGVATIVAKLLLRALPHVAVFGEKDYQQLCVIRRLVLDLDMPITIIGVPTVREADGLAMSSRNAYLSPDERKTAPLLHQTLQETLLRMEGGMKPADAIRVGRETLEVAGFVPDYLTLADPVTLTPLDTFTRPARLLVAAKLGNTRLIDNIGVEQ